jgi:hypothetical protein
MRLRRDERSAPGDLIDELEIARTAPRDSGGRPPQPRPSEDPDLPGDPDENLPDEDRPGDADEGLPGDPEEELPEDPDEDA